MKCAVVVLVRIMSVIWCALCSSCCQCCEDGLHSVPSGTSRGCPCMFACLCHKTGLSRLTLVYASCHLPEVSIKIYWSVKFNFVTLFTISVCSLLTVSCNTNGLRAEWKYL